MDNLLAELWNWIMGCVAVSTALATACFVPLPKFLRPLRLALAGCGSLIIGIGLALFQARDVSELLMLEGSLSGSLPFLGGYLLLGAGFFLAAKDRTLAREKLR